MLEINGETNASYWKTVVVGTNEYVGNMMSVLRFGEELQCNENCFADGLEVTLAPKGSVGVDSISGPSGDGVVPEAFVEMISYSGLRMGEIPYIVV